MSTENLKLIIDLISGLGDGARSTFLWYLAYDLIVTVLICVTWVVVPVFTTRAIFKGIKSVNERER